MRLKFILLVVISCLAGSAGYAQAQRMVYYLKDSGTLVSTKDSADYWMEVSPPDTSISKFWYVVREYGKNGKVRLQTTSKTNDLNLFYHGKYTAFYPDGKMMRTGEYLNGKFSGLETGYYHNGNIYNIKDYKSDGTVRFVECRDSTGKVLAENGKGTWLEYDKDFKDATAKGEIVNGLMSGVWNGKTNESGRFRNVYEKGVLKEHNVFQKFEITPEMYASAKPEAVPTFPGGMESLYRFLAKTLLYPKEARVAGIQGKVIVSFMVEIDGTLSDIKIDKSVDVIIDDEALRVMKLSPKWIPAVKDGKPVRMPFSLPINFALSQ